MTFLSAAAAAAHPSLHQEQQPFPQPPGPLAISPSCCSLCSISTESSTQGLEPPKQREITPLASCCLLKLTVTLNLFLSPGEES